MILTLTIKNVYGNEMAYPACDKSRAFADLLNTKTLTDRHIEKIKALGYTIELAAPAKPKGW